MKKHWLSSVKMVSDNTDLRQKSYLSMVKQKTKVIYVRVIALGLIICLLLISSCHKHEPEIQIPNNLWIKINTPLLDKTFAIQFINADTGYILGAHQRDDSIYNILIKTFDGGETWKSIAYKQREFLTDTSGGLMQIMYVSPFEPNIIFSGARNLLRSTDGGLHWQKVDTVNKRGTPNMYFFNPANGLCSNGYEICKTIDSGFNWTPIFDHSSFAGFQILPFLNPQIGYFVGGAQFDGSSSGIMGKTIDGGNTWQILDYPFADIVSASFVNDSIGYVTMLTSTGNIGMDYLGYEFIKTTDGGNTWQVIRQTPNDNKSYGYYNLYFKSEQEGYCTIKGIFHTLDGGYTWEEESNITASLLCFPNNTTGYAIDVDGNLYKRSL